MAKITPIDIIKGVSRKFGGGNSKEDFATNKCSYHIHLAKRVNSSVHPPFILRWSSVRAPFELRSTSVRAPFNLRSSSVRAPFKLRSSSVQAPFELRSSSVQPPFELRSSSVRAPFNLRSSSVRAPFKLRSGSVRESENERRTKGGVTITHRCWNEGTAKHKKEPTIQKSNPTIIFYHLISNYYGKT